jgi:hypothetical protein
VEQFGETPQALRDVSVSLRQVGDVEKIGGEGLGGPREAIVLYRESLEICRRIVEQFGETPEALRDVSLSLEGVGDVERIGGEGLGGPGEAIVLYRDSLKIRRRIVEQFGETPEALRDVALSLQRTAQVQAALGERDAGVNDAREALGLLKRVMQMTGPTPEALDDIARTEVIIGAVGSGP